MKKIFYNMFVITALIICSMLFVSCDAITAQNINPDSFSGINGVPMPGGINGNPNRSAGQGRNNEQGIGNRSGKNGITNGNFMGEMMNADLIGKIISVDGNSIEVELIQQAGNSNSSVLNNNSLNLRSNKNTDSMNTQPSLDNQGEMPELNLTGTYKTIIINDDVSISLLRKTQRQNQNNPSKSSIKVSDLKKDEIIMMWYKEDTETVERINVIQS